jgi:hypothetical protein
MYKAIEVMMIIHNISIEWGDKPEDLWDTDGVDGWSDSSEGEEEDGDNEVQNGIIGGEPHIPLHETENWLLVQGRQKWLILLNELIPE